VGRPMMEERKVQELIQRGLKELQMMKVRLCCMRGAFACVRGEVGGRVEELAAAGGIDGVLLVEVFTAGSRAVFIRDHANTYWDEQRQTVISQFYQLDRLVVEGQKTVSALLPPFSYSPQQITQYTC